MGDHALNVAAVNNQPHHKHILPMRTSFQRTLAALLAAVLTAVTAHATPEGWTDDLDKALDQAKADKKLVLLDFTGSDWCSWCIKMDKEVFSQKEFKDYAAKNLVLVEVDFPQKKELVPVTKVQNDKLKAKHEVNGFPTFVVLDGEGNELAKWPGYQAGGPSALIAKLNALKK